MTSTTLAEVSNDLLYGAMVVYALAMLGFAGELSLWRPVRDRVEQEELVGAWTAGSLAGAVPPEALADTSGMARAARADRFGRVGVSLTVLAFLLHLASVVARGWSAERAPWGNMFEFSVTGALAVTGVYLVLLSRRDIRYLGTFVVLPVLLTLGLAVTAAIIASGLFTIGFAQTICFLVQDRLERKPDVGPTFMDRLPNAAALDRAAYSVHAFAYPIWTFAVIAGAIWAENAWGRYWGWDPKEVWAFITWLVYTAYLHARATAGWKGRKSAYIALAGYATFLFNYVVVNIWLVGFHSYAGV